MRPTLAESKTVIALSSILFSVFFGFMVYMFFFFKWRSDYTELQEPHIPAYFNGAEYAMPFPATLDPSLFRSGPIRDAYSVAKQWPDVLVQQPCYCPASHFRSLLDCFVDVEATQCVICINEARLAARLHLEGKTASEIRGTIIREYTPTSVSQGRRLPLSPPEPPE